MGNLFDTEFSLLRHDLDAIDGSAWERVCRSSGSGRDGESGNVGNGEHNVVACRVVRLSECSAEVGVG